MSSTMVAERVRTQLRSLAGAGLDQESFAQSAFDLVGRVVPFDGACLGTFDPATHLVTRTEKLAIDHSHDRVWAHFEYEYDDVAQFLTLSQRPNRATTIETETGGDGLASSRLRDFLRPVYSFRHELRSAVAVDGAVWGGIALHRGEGCAAFTELEVEFVSTVGSAIAHGLRTALMAVAINTVGDDVDGPAVLIVGADDEIVQVSAGAEARFAELTGAPFEPWNQLPLPMLSLVATARAHAAGRATPPPRLRVRSPRGDWWVAHAAALASREGGGRDVVITIEEARPPEIVPIVVAAFGLTPRERDVVRLVLQGIDTGEIARTLHLSAFTVQDHLKSIFAKAGVRSRRELMARVFFDQYADRLCQDVGPNGWFVPTSLDA